MVRKNYCIMFLSRYLYRPDPPKSKRNNAVMNDWGFRTRFVVTSIASIVHFFCKLRIKSHNGYKLPFLIAQQYNRRWTWTHSRWSTGINPTISTNLLTKRKSKSTIFIFLSSTQDKKFTSQFILSCIFDKVMTTIDRGNHYRDPGVCCCVCFKKQKAQN